MNMPIPAVLTYDVIQDREYYDEDYYQDYNIEYPECAHIYGSHLGIYYHAYSIESSNL